MKLRFYGPPVENALHEASHYLKARDEGFNPLWASILPEKGRLGHCKYRRPKNPDQDQTMGLVRVHLAGYLGSSVCLKGRVEPLAGAYGDFSKARDRIRTLTDCPKEEKRLFYQAKRETLNFVLAPMNLAAIHELGDELMESGFFDAERAEKLIRQAHDRLRWYNARN